MSLHTSVAASFTTQRQLQETQAALRSALELEATLRSEIERLKCLVEEKSDLLKEVNHRAKNSLQMAMALLSMQALSSSEESVAEALQAAAQRLSHLARVHELLYQRGDDVQEISLHDFLAEIAGTLSAAYPTVKATLCLDVEEISLDVNRAINAALLVGEAMLNSFKYAFPEGWEGNIRVTCYRSGQHAYLCVSDDGEGFEAEARRGSLGLRLLRALGRSLGGETQITGNRGTVVEVSFPVAEI